MHTSSAHVRKHGHCHEHPQGALQYQYCFMPKVITSGNINNQNTMKGKA